jgi:hypothetical protein
MLGNYRVAAQLVASRVALGSAELVTYSVQPHHFTIVYSASKEMNARNHVRGEVQRAHNVQNLITICEAVV